MANEDVCAKDLLDESTQKVDCTKHSHIDKFNGEQGVPSLFVFASFVSFLDFEVIGCLHEASIGATIHENKNIEINIEDN